MRRVYLRSESPGAIPGHLVWRSRKKCLSLLIAFAIHISFCGRTRAENHADYKYESYIEEGGRIEIQTHSILLEQLLGSKVTLKGEYVRDAVSGASPTGAPPPAGSNQVPLKHMEDLRNAGFLEADVQLGITTLSPQVSYSLGADS